MYITEKKTMPIKEARIIANYLDAKLAELTTGINYWGAEGNKTNNSEKRQAECNKSLFALQSAYDEIYSMYINLPK